MPTAQQQFYYKSNRLQQLRGFCFAAQFGNISRAAEHLGLTQSSVSLQVKALEDELGCKLFKRAGSRITITPDGERLLQMAQPLVDGIQGLYEEFHAETKAQIQSELHIAVNHTIKNYLLPPIVNAYLESNPSVRIVLHAAEQHEAAQLLQAGAVDLALLPRRQHLPFPRFCEYTPIFHFKPCLITPKNHPLAGRRNLSPAEINRYPLTLPDEELRVITDLHHLFASQDATLRLRFVNFETGREYIEAGHVITISSDIWIKEDDVLIATPLTHLLPLIDYGMVCKRGKTMPAKVKNFINLAMKHAEKRSNKPQLFE